MNDNKYGFIDENGKEIIKPIYDQASNLKNNMIILEKDNKVGVLIIK